MAYTVVNAAKVMATNVDSYNLAGIYSTGDLENGVLVTLSGMNIDSTSKRPKGFEYNVALANNNTASDAYIIASPEVPLGLENLYVDPRQFINKAGKPLAIKKLGVGDIWEVSKEAFYSAADFPEASEVGYYVPVSANGGKLGAPQQGAISAKISFRVEALTKMAIGDELVDACLLRVMLA